MKSDLFPANYINPVSILESSGLEELIRATYPQMIVAPEYIDPLWNLLLAYRDYQKSECSLQMAQQLGLVYFGACNKKHPLRFDLDFINQPLLIKYLKLESWYETCSLPDNYKMLTHRFVKQGDKRSFINRFWCHASTSEVDNALRRGLTIKNFQREKSKTTKYLVKLLGSDQLEALDLIIGSVKT